jgi:serine protease Do
LRENGKVTRGYLGVRFQPLTADLAKSFGLDSEKGALIASVEKNSPAERAGFKAGDIILEFDGKLIAEGTELPRYVAVTPIDKKVRVVIFRDGRKLDLHVTVGKLNDSEQASADKESGSSQSDRIGITVQELTQELAASLGIKESKGLVITEVKPGSPAEDSGIPSGTVIIEINGQHPDSLEKFNTVVSALKKGDIARLLLRRPDGSIQYLAVKVE